MVREVLNSDGVGVAFSVQLGRVRGKLGGIPQ